MSDLHDLVDVWRATSADLSAFARTIPPDAWHLESDLPGWDVHDVFAHCAALESELAGVPPLRVEIDKSAPHITGPAGVYTERGVVGRRDRSPMELIAEFDSAVDVRAALLADEPLDDPTGNPPVTPGRIGWNWATLLRNRPVDLWVHEQDIRRAVSLPGGLDTTGARHTQGVFALGLGFVLVKRAGASPGTTLVVEITGPVSARYGIEVADDGRGRPVDPAGLTPTVRLTMDTEAFTILGAGRRDPTSLDVAVEGDVVLAAAILRGLELTP